MSDSNWHDALETLMHMPEPEPEPDPEPEAPPMPALPPVPLERVSDETHDLARRAITRAAYDVTGYVLTQRTRGGKCITDGKQTVWLPAGEFDRLVKWQKPKQATPPEGFEPPPADVSEGEAALGVLAMRLGIPYSAEIPHNAGWFVPGIADAFPSAGEAIEALFDLIYTSPDATVYRPGKPGRAAGIVITGNVVVSGDIVAAPPHGMGPAPAAVTAERPPAPKAKAPPPAAEAPQLGLF